MALNALIVGGNGGIGLAFVEHLLADENYEIIATYRSSCPELSHPRLQWMQLDAADEEQVSGFCMQLGEVDLCVIAVGMLHDELSQPEKATRHIEADYFQRSMRVNVLPTLLLAKCLAGHFRHKRPAVFATISARVGSIGENQLGGWYSYRASKAALNQVLKTLSIEWKRNLKNVTVAALHPGTTDTDLSRPFHRNLPPGQLQTAEQSVSAMMQVIDGLTPAQTGQFWSFDGEQLPW